LSDEERKRDRRAFFRSIHGTLNHLLLTDLSGTRYAHPLAPALLHLFNHETHHRGQITTLLSQLGIDPGVTDVIAYYRERGKYGLR
jgi:uncharacterized damage-inducible protein DinB